MSQLDQWALEQLTQVVQADRLAEAEHDRLVSAAGKPSPPLRAVLADALRALATRIDDTDRVPAPQSARRLAVAR